MFDFFLDAFNYEDRKVDRFEKENLIIDTCSCSDGEHSYETAIKHESYNNRNWVIVEAYDSKEEAQVGHNKWVKIMTSNDLPEYLMDCGNAIISKLCDTTLGELSMRFPKQQ